MDARERYARVPVRYRRRVLARYKLLRRKQFLWAKQDPAWTSGGPNAAMFHAVDEVVSDF